MLLKAQLTVDAGRCFPNVGKDVVDVSGTNVSTRPEEQSAAAKKSPEDQVRKPDPHRDITVGKTNQADGHEKERRNC